MITKISAVVATLGILFSCHNQGHIENLGTKIKVHNKTLHTLEDVAIFSIKMGNIPANQESKYLSLKYNYLQDDPIISFKIGEHSLVQFLPIPDTIKKHLDYYIDSVDLESNLAFITITTD